MNKLFKKNILKENFCISVYVLKPIRDETFPLIFLLFLTKHLEIKCVQNARK